MGSYSYIFQKDTPTGFTKLWFKKRKSVDDRPKRLFKLQQVATYIYSLITYFLHALFFCFEIDHDESTLMGILISFTAT